MPPDREGGKTESDLYISIAVVRLTVTASRRRVQQGEGTNGERRTRRDEERGKDQRQGESQNRKSSLRAFRVDSWRSLRAARRRTIGGGIVGSEEGEEDEEILRLNTGVPVHGDAPPGSGPAPVRGGGEYYRMRISPSSDPIVRGRRCGIKLIRDSDRNPHSMN